ncbi:MAG: hypothetical protein JOZ39_02330, partial [Chloroflexi bacterium]|nr:hypothetical protein [Chloroflexota bacterium]
TDFTWFAQGLDAAGRLTGQDDRPPLAPTSTWQPRDRFLEVFQVPAAGVQSLEIGAYDRTGRRVQFACASADCGDRVLLPVNAANTAG